MGRNSIIIAVLWGLTFPMTGAALAETVEVGIKDYKFQPAELKIKAGTTVKWVNNENALRIRCCSPERAASSRSGFSRANPGSASSTSRAAIPIPADRIRR